LIQKARLVRAIKEEYRQLEKAVRHTPLVRTSLGIPDLPATVYLKLENFQKTGSFKVRGALAKLRSLSQGDRKNGVVSASAGNHAQGVAWAARLLGIRAAIVMPENASLAKQKATQSYGAEVILSGKNFEEAFSFAQALSQSEKKPFIHAFDDERIIAGQGSLGIEILKDLPEVSAVFIPVGGGGLAAGIGVYMKSVRPSIKVIGVRAKAKNSVRSLYPPIADGIAVKRMGSLTGPLLESCLDEVITVSEEEISSAIFLLLERRKIIAEGAGASSVAGYLKAFRRFENHQAVLLISGGNIDVTLIEKILERGLVKAGRLFRFQLEVDDAPGKLSEITRLIAEEKANILHVVHDRYSLHIPLYKTRIEFSLETKGPGHILEIKRKLRKAGYQISAVS